MGEMVRERSKLIVGVLLTFVVAVAGLGTALALPNDDIATASDCEHEWQNEENIVFQQVMNPSNGEWINDEVIDGNHNFACFSNGYEDYRGVTGSTLTRTCDLCGTTQTGFLRLQYDSDIDEPSCTSPYKVSCTLTFVDKNTYNEETYKTGQVYCKSGDHSYEWIYGDSTEPQIEEYNGNLIYRPGGVERSYVCSNCGDVSWSDNNVDTPNTDAIYYIWKDGDKEVAKYYPKNTSQNWVTSDPVSQNLTCTVVIPTWSENVFEYTITPNKTLSTPIAKSEFNGLGWFCYTNGGTNDWLNGQADYYDQNARAAYPSSSTFSLVTPIIYVEYPYSEEPEVHFFVETISWAYLHKVDGQDYMLANPSEEDVEGLTPSTPSPDQPGHEGGVSATLSLTFRATGIQSTSFNDYKEAMAALNSGRN